MNEIDINKYDNIINKKNKSNKEQKIKKYFINLSLRILVIIMILFSLSIVYKTDNILKDRISHYFFKENLSFAKMKNMKFC